MSQNCLFFLGNTTAHPSYFAQIHGFVANFPNGKSFSLVIRRCHAPLFAVIAAAAATLPSWKALDLANAARAFAAARAWPPVLQRAVAQRSVACDLVPPRRMADGRCWWMLDVKPQERLHFPIIFLTLREVGFSHGGIVFTPLRVGWPPTPQVYFGP